MKKIVLFLLLMANVVFSQENTATVKAGKYQMNIPEVGVNKDSLVVWNGSTKIMKILPVSQLKTITNIDYVATPTGGTIFSSAGNDAVVPLATTTNAGLFGPTDKSKLNGVATGATANDTDANLKNRANHTGTQPISTVTSLQASLDTKVDKVAGKGLSTEDYTTAEKTKLAGIASGATANSTDAQLRDRSTHTGTQAISTVVGLQSAIDSKINLSLIGVNNGVAPLDAGGKVPFSVLPASLMIYKGMWNPTTNTPTLADGTGVAGWVYKVSVDGSANLGSGTISYLAGYFLIHNGTKWERSAGTDNVVSVNGQQGVVSLTTANIPDTTNKRYQTDSQQAYNDATSSIQTQLNGKQAAGSYEPAFSKNTAFNKNFGTVAGTVAEGNDTRINNGQTAFGWGNHAGLYLGINSNAVSASKWATPRTITIGSTGKNIDGTGNVSWTQGEIGFNNGSTLTNNISGTAAVATNFGGTTGDFSSSIDIAPQFMVGYASGAILKPYTVIGIKSFLGLSSAITGTGVNGRVAIWTGTNTQTEDSGLRWDATARSLNVSRAVGGTGNITPTLNLNSTTDGAYSGGVIAFSSDSFTNKLARIAGVRDNVAASSRLDFSTNSDIYNASDLTSVKMSILGNGNVGIGTTPLTAGGAAKWLTIDGTTTYGGGLISSLNGVAKAYYYYENGYANVQGIAGIGVKLQANGVDALTVLPSGSVTSVQGITAPTFNGDLNGNAYSANYWGNSQADFGSYASVPSSWVAGYDSATNKVKPWDITQLRTFLGLGSNAYTSTAYLPLTGGTLSGVIRVLINSEVEAITGKFLKYTTNPYGMVFRSYDTGKNSIQVQRESNDTEVFPLQLQPLGGLVLLGQNASVADTGSITATGFFQSSDRRLKNIIKRDGDVVYFKWKDGRDSKTHIGYIAQEVRKDFPDQVQKNEDGKLSVNYVEILVAKIQDLEKRVKELENRK